MQGCAQVEVCFGIVRCEFQRLAKVAEGRLELTLRLHDRAEVVVGSGVARVMADRFRERCPCPGQVALGMQHSAQAIVRPRIIGPHRYRPSKARQRLRLLAEDQQGLAVGVGEDRIVGDQHGRLTILLAGLRHLPRILGDHAEKVNRLGRPGLPLKHLLAQPRRRGRIAGLIAAVSLVAQLMGRGEGHVSIR